MWKKIYSQVVGDINRRDAWSVLIDVNQWPLWHEDLEACSMTGPFQVGNFFMLKPRSMKAVKIILTEVKEGYYFTDMTSFFGARMFDTHALEETKDGLQITNTLTVDGPLRWLWIFLVARHVAATIPEEIESLIEQVKERRNG